MGQGMKFEGLTGHVFLRLAMSQSNISEYGVAGYVDWHKGFAVMFWQLNLSFFVSLWLYGAHS